MKYETIVIEILSWLTIAFFLWVISIPWLAEGKDYKVMWDANKETDLVGYKVYVRATTDKAFRCVTTLHKQTEAKVTLDGRRNWWFYVTARNAVFESTSSNNVLIQRGY